VLVYGLIDADPLAKTIATIERMLYGRLLASPERRPTALTVSAKSSSYL
jgi:hypothetical protein